MRRQFSALATTVTQLKLQDKGKFVSFGHIIHDLIKYCHLNIDWYQLFDSCYFGVFMDSCSTKDAFVSLVLNSEKMKISQ